jgi:hypothetical protein
LNTTPAPQDRTPTNPRNHSETAPSPQRRSRPAHTPHQGGPPERERLRGATTDPLNHPDPRAAAEAATVENLLRCWARETDLPAPTGGAVRIPLPASGTSLLVPVHYWSPTGWHRFGLPQLANAPGQAPPADAVTVAALLNREGLTAESPASAAGAEVVARVADSVRRRRPRPLPHRRTGTRPRPPFAPGPQEPRRSLRS